MSFPVADLGTGPKLSCQWISKIILESVVDVIVLLVVDSMVSYIDRRRISEHAFIYLSPCSVNNSFAPSWNMFLYNPDVLL